MYFYRVDLLDSFQIWTRAKYGLDLNMDSRSNVPLANVEIIN